VIEAQWEKFRQWVIPVNASATQLIEMRRAFYAGAEAVLDGTAGLMSESETATEKDIEVCRSIVAELKEFARRVAEGVA